MNFFTQKLRTLLLLAVVLVGGVSTGWAQTQTWDVGETPGTVFATLDGATLKISGKGRMKDSPATGFWPWVDLRNSIYSVEVGRGVYSIGDGAFGGCTKIEIVEIPDSVRSIGHKAFSGCYNLKHVNAPKGVVNLESIGGSAFSDCEKLETVMPGSTVKMIGGWAFRNCGKLVNIFTITEGIRGRDVLQYIGESAFEGCISLGSVKIPNTVETLGAKAFLGCTKLTSVTIGNSVEYIGDSVFANCTGLTSILCLSYYPPSKDINGYKATNLFLGVNKSSVCLQVPKDALLAYHDNPIWGAFSCLNALSSDYVVVMFDLKGGTFVIGCDFDGRGCEREDSVKSVAVARADIVGAGVRDPILHGYAVTGWYRDAELLNEWNLKTSTVGPDMTLYAKWTPTYSVYFNGNGNNGGSVPSTQTVVQGGNAAKPNSNPTRTGNVFVGWYRDSAGTGAEWNFNTDIVTADITLYAKWTPGYTWYCGKASEKDVAATLTKNNGTLAVSGSKNMKDYSSSSKAPWDSLKSYIRNVVIETDVPNIGNYAFAETPTITTVTIPVSMIAIGDDAFRNCVGITTIVSLSEVPPAIGGMFTFYGINKPSVKLYVPASGINAYRSAEHWKDFNILDVAGYEVPIVSVASSDRVIPRSNPSEAVTVSPIAALTAEFTAGPNPVGALRATPLQFFRTGAVITNAALHVYDASGNSVRKIFLSDNAVVGSSVKRSVGSWDLRDAKGRTVSAGTYLVKGVIKTSGGKRESVSLVVGVK